MLTNSSKGFTLIELLVVVALLGIISAVGTVAYQGYVKGAKENSASNILQQISLAQLEHYSNSGEYYTTGDAGASTVCDANQTTSAQIEDVLFGDADGNLNDVSARPQVLDDPNQLPDDIEFEFCVHGDKSISYTIEAQSSLGDSDCVIKLSKNGAIIKEDCWYANL